MVCTNEGAHRKAYQASGNKSEREVNQICGPCHEENRKGDHRENSHLSRGDAASGDAHGKKTTVVDDVQRRTQHRRSDVLPYELEEIERDGDEEHEDER